MADDSELDHIRTFLEAVHKGTLQFSDVVASVTPATKTVVMTTNGGTLNQWAGYCLYAYSGDNAGTEYTVVSNTNATPTTMIVSEVVPADLATDLVRLYTGSTTKHKSETGQITNIDDTSRLYIFPGEIMGVEMNTRIIIKRYKVQMYESTEALLSAALKNVIGGLDDLNTRKAIAGYTKPASLYSGKFLNSTKAYENSSTKHWTLDIMLEFKWSTL